MNVYEDAPVGEEKDMKRAVRKLTRAIIETVKETVKEDAKTVRSDISPNYHTGTVKYKGKKVGEWNDGTMQVLDDAYGARFRNLIGN